MGAERETIIFVHSGHIWLSISAFPSFSFSCLRNGYWPKVAKCPPKWAQLMRGIFSSLSPWVFVYHFSLIVHRFPLGAQSWQNQIIASNFSFQICSFVGAPLTTSNQINSHSRVQCHITCFCTLPPTIGTSLWNPLSPVAEVLKLLMKKGVFDAKR